MDSVSKQQSPHAFFFCPYAKFENEEDEFRSIQFGESPILSSSSSSSSHLRPLDWCSNKEGKYDNFSCPVCKKSLAGTSFYSCKGCNIIFMGYHKECIEPISKHTYHPRHPLRLEYLRLSTLSTKVCLCCSKYSEWVYSCSICDFIMCLNCTEKPPILEINQPKRHEHTLFYFPRKGSLICDVCALSHHRSLMYSCTQCDFVTHKACIYFPCIIRISRHEHRLSFNSSLTPEKRLCGVCRGKIDTKYGRYSCVKGCIYSVHSQCATRKDLWDGKELEGTPEDAPENIKSFIEISDGVIQHLNHQDHRMRLEEETNGEFDENKRCHACTLPICDDTIYKCMQCDYVLHKSCAHLPRKIYHPVHPHPLYMQVGHQDVLSRCRACYRYCNGFVYLCKDCKYFRLDVNCAAISEPLDHPSHPHPLFLTSEPSRSQKCSICQSLEYVRLNCGECGFVLGFRCATLPNKLRYKHDEHFLICCYDKDASDQYRCDVCEKKADPKKNRFYMCKDCNVTLHIECLLGDKYSYIMMPGKVFKLNGRNVTTLLNNCLTRDICRVCTSRCKNKVVYNISDRERLCSYNCVYNYLYDSYN